MVIKNKFILFFSLFVLLNFNNLMLSSASKPDYSRFITKNHYDKGYMLFAKTVIGSLLMSGLAAAAAVPILGSGISDRTRKDLLFVGLVGAFSGILEYGIISYLALIINKKYNVEKARLDNRTEIEVLNESIEKEKSIRNELREVLELAAKLNEDLALNERLEIENKIIKISLNRSALQDMLFDQNLILAIKIIKKDLKALQQRIAKLKEELEVRKNLEVQYNSMKKLSHEILNIRGILLLPNKVYAS